MDLAFPPDSVPIGGRDSKGDAHGALRLPYCLRMDPRLPSEIGARPARTAPQPVTRGALLCGAGIEVRDNLCCRKEPGLSEETRPLEFHEIVFPRNGVWIRHRGRRDELVVDACRAHLFARGESHRVSHPAGCGDRNTGFVPTDATLFEIDPRAFERGFALPAVPIDALTYAEHCALVEGLLRRHVDALEGEERALRLVETVLAGARVRRRARHGSPRRSARQRRAHAELAHAAQRVLATAFRERLGLGGIAAALGVSVYHLCRVFRAEHGTSLHAYRRSLRVRAALRALCDPSATLYDIAETAGFSDRTQLSRALRQTLGQPPSAFRERLRRDPAREQDSPRAARSRA